MSRSRTEAAIRNFLKTIDWKLLIFLLLFMHVKLVVKLVALLFIYVVRPNFNIGFGIKKSRLPLFYLLVILIAVINWVILGSFFKLDYLVVLLNGIAFWVACILAVHQLKLSVEKNDPAIIHQTLLLFFIINALASYAVYASIVFETGAINPFRYQGNFQKYFMGTGDYIKGISFDTSTTNAVINAFGVLYFLNRKNAAMTLLCMATLLLTGSNISNLLLGCIFLYLFVFSSNGNQKSIIVVCLMFGVIFMSKVSPQNNKYLEEGYNRIFKKQPSNKTIAANAPVVQNVMSNEETKQKIAKDYIDSVDKILFQQQLQSTVATAIKDTMILKAEKISIPQPNIHTASFQYKNDTTALQKKLLSFSVKQTAALPLANSVKPVSKLPGKIIALQQTARFFQLHPGKIALGGGVANFSSKLAFRATALKIAGGYPVRFAYINPDFESNHLDLYLSYFTRQDKLHSLTNSPNSVYDQLWSEYGIAGLLALAFFYFGYFIRHKKVLTYGIPVLLFAAGIFFMEYWFEQLSVIVLFELLMLLDISEHSIVKTVDHD